MKIEGRPFEIQILGQDGKPATETEEGYVGLAHCEPYKIQLSTSEPFRSIAVQLKIDGTEIPHFFVFSKNSPCCLETFPGKDGKLTFFAAGTEEAKRANLAAVSQQDLGVISATFFSGELEPRLPRWGWRTSSYYGSQIMRGGDSPFQGARAGGTGLSGISNQEFVRTTFDEDISREPVTINLRLVLAEKIGVRPLHKPQPPTSNPVPAPLP